MTIKNAVMFLMLVVIFSPFPVKVLADAVEQRTVRIGVYENPPKIYTDKDGTVKGFWADIINDFAQKENWKVDYVNGTFNEGLENLTNGKIDMMVDVGYSGPRSLIYDFTNETAFINWAGVYSSPNLNVESFQDFENKTVAVLKGDIHFEGPLGIKALMTSFGYKATYLEVASYADVLKAVSDGKADIGIVNRLFGTAEEHNYQIKRTSVVFDPIELKFAFPKNGASTEYFKTTIDKDLKALKADSESIYYKSIITNLEGVVRTVEIAPSWTTPIIVASLLITLIAVLLYIFSKSYQRTLEQKVKEKTKQLEEKVEELEAAMQLMLEKGL